MRPRGIGVILGDELSAEATDGSEEIRDYTIKEAARGALVPRLDPTRTTLRAGRNGTDGGEGGFGKGGEGVLLVVVFDGCFLLSRERSARGR
jgi:hypothetical protein